MARRALVDVDEIKQFGGNQTHLDRPGSSMLVLGMSHELPCTTRSRHQARRTDSEHMVGLPRLGFRINTGGTGS